MADQPFSSSPAWDPSSRTPLPIPEDAAQSDSDSCLTDPSYQHTVSQVQNTAPNVLMDPRLLNAHLRICILDGMFKGKTVVASIEAIDGRPCIRYKHYKMHTLKPEHVAPKHPNATRDNGLLVVIKGEHSGKYVRRIHHRYDGKEAILILAVVNREAGKMDSLTGERLELDVTCLCLCDELKDDKKLNSSLMDMLREEARKIRAK